MSEYSRALAWLRKYPPPGGMREGHPDVTPEVLAALVVARRTWQPARALTDRDGPHLHHWEPILWVCRGCGEFDEIESD